MSNSEGDRLFCSARIGGEQDTNKEFLVIHIPIPGRSTVAVVSVLTNTAASLKQTHFAPGVYAAKFSGFNRAWKAFETA